MVALLTRRLRTAQRIRCAAAPRTQVCVRVAFDGCTGANVAQHKASADPERHEALLLLCQSVPVLGAPLGEAWVAHDAEEEVGRVGGSGRGDRHAGASQCGASQCGARLARG